ncbi:MAG: hypothetical protein R6U58_03565 [Bacteroidales bacterium]
MKTFLKKFLPIILLLTLSFSLLVPKPASAATNYKNWFNATKLGKVTGDNLNFHNIANSVWTFIAAVWGRINPDTEEIEQTGAIQTTTDLIAYTFAHPPASGVYYARDILDNLGAKTAYAQGIGFTGLQPILPIWKAFRNVTYILFTIIFIAVGLAIMLRVKISPQAVITVENAIPKVIGALILITFSYAIAGFMIDLMYVLSALGVTILKTNNINPQFYLGKNPTPNNVINSGFFGLVPIFFSHKGSFLVAKLFAGIFAGAFGLGLAGPGGALAGLLLGPGIITLIWGIIALVLLFKLFFALIKAYINIIVSVILAPFQLMLGAIPGMQAGGFGNWFKNLLAEILIFPAVIIIAIIGNYITQTGHGQALWIAPLIGPPTAVLNTTVMTNNFVKSIVGMGFLVFLVRVPDIIRKAMQVEGLGSAIGGILPFEQYGELGKQYAIGTGLTTTETKLRSAEKKAGSLKAKQRYQKWANRVRTIHNAAKNMKASG